MAPRASASYRTAVAATAALLAVAGTAAAQSAALCQAQWNTAQRTYRQESYDWQRAQTDYNIAKAQYNREYKAWSRASKKASKKASNWPPSPRPYVPPRPQRPVNRAAGPKPQPPSQAQYQSCLRQAATIEAQRSAPSTPEPEPTPAPAPACEGDCCDVSPPASTYSCEQQAAWGKCGEPWMSGFCDLSCGRCASSEADVAANATATANATANATDGHRHSAAVEDLPDATNRRLLLGAVL